MSNRAKRWTIVLLVISLLVASSLACEWDSEDWTVKTDAEDTLVGGTCDDGYREAYTPNPDDGFAVYCEEIE